MLPLQFLLLLRVRLLQALLMLLLLLPLVQLLLISGLPPQDPLLSSGEYELPLLLHTHCLPLLLLQLRQQLQLLLLVHLAQMLLLLLLLLLSQDLVGVHPGGLRNSSLEDW